MGLKENRLESLEEKIFVAYENETASKGLFRYVYFFKRWLLMLWHEFIADDVKIRAESMAYLMLFSIMPLIAGLFFVFTLFTQFAFVQESIAGFSRDLLSSFPKVHQEVLMEYTLKFKDTYLQSMAGKSGKLGIFALVFLFWVGLQTFTNIESTINAIWGSERERGFLERLRNFLVVAIGAPFVLIASLSLPLIARNFVEIDWLSKLNFVFPILVTLSTFALLYRFLPVTPVRWKSAFNGALFATVMLQICNLGMNYYFRFGTHTAYGKAAIIPLVGFWFYIVWIIIILGAEFSFLTQNQKQLARRTDSSITLLEIETCVQILERLRQNYNEGRGPLSFDQLLVQNRIPMRRLNKLLHFLEERQYLVSLKNRNQEGTLEYLLSKNIDKENVGHLVRMLLQVDRDRQETSPVLLGLDQAVQEYLKKLDGVTFA